MTLRRRDFLHLAAGAMAMPAVPRVAFAQAYPSRPVRFIVAFAAGSAPDIIARLIGQWLSDQLGQPFVIDNRPGAASNISAPRPPCGGAGRLHGSDDCLDQCVQHHALLHHLNFNFVADVTHVAGVAMRPMS